MYVPVGLPRLYSIKIFNCGKPSKVIEKFFDAEEDLINPISAGGTINVPHFFRRLFLHEKRGDLEGAGTLCPPTLKLHSKATHY